MESYKKRVMATASLHHLCNDGSVVVLPTIFPILFSSGHLIHRYSDIGTMIMIGLVVAILFQHVIGHNAKCNHSRFYLAADALLVGISLVLMTLSKNFAMLVIFFIGVRMGTSIYHPVGISWISHVFTGGKLDKAMGVQSASGNIGVFLAFTTTGLLAEHFGWKAPLYIWGGINMLAVGIGLAISKGTKLDALEAVSKEKISWKQTFGTIKKYIPLMILSGMCWGITINYAPSLLNHSLGISIGKTGTILGFWMVAGTLSAFFYGNISGKLGRVKAVSIAYITIFAMTLIITLSRSPALTAASLMIYGIVLFLTYPANLSFVGSDVSGRNRTAAFSIVSNMMIISNSISSFVAGFLSDRFSIHFPFVLISAFSLLLLGYVTIMRKKGRILSPAES